LFCIVAKSLIIWVLFEHLLSFAVLFTFTIGEAVWYPKLLNAIWQAAVLAVVLMINFVRRAAIYVRVLLLVCMRILCSYRCIVICVTLLLCAITVSYLVSLQSSAANMIFSHFLMGLFIKCMPYMSTFVWEFNITVSSHYFDWMTEIILYYIILYYIIAIIPLGFICLY